MVERECVLLGVADFAMATQRVLLQGFDTATHFAIVTDVCAAHPRLWTHVGAVALVWALHSLICQVTPKSTTQQRQTLCRVECVLM
jgi:hypothetical protein